MAYINVKKGMGWCGKKIQNIASILFLKFVIFVFLYQLELTYGSVILANDRPNTYQYSGKTIFSFDNFVITPVRGTGVIATI